jgi:hypothetical protein
MISPSTAEVLLLVIVTALLVVRSFVLPRFSRWLTRRLEAHTRR